MLLLIVTKIKIPNIWMRPVAFSVGLSEPRKYMPSGTFQVHLAEMRGAIGIILFSDPADVTDGNIDQVYPHDWWLPPSGAQRGTVYIGSGDPLTPGYPSIG